MTGDLVHALRWALPPCAALGLGACAPTLILVERGAPNLTAGLSSGFASQNGTLVLTGLGRQLRAPVALGTRGDVELRMSIDALQGSAASVVLDGDSHFGLDGRGQQVFVEGPLFGGATRGLGPARALFTPGVPFTLRIDKRAGWIALAIDERTVLRQRHELPLLTVALRPHRGTLRVSHFALAGDVVIEPHVGGDVVQHATVFRSGEHGYATFRIPAVVRAANGDLLAFAEGRVAGPGDSGDIDLVLKRSTDAGATWGALQAVAEHGDGVLGNPAPVVDRGTGDVVLLCVAQPPGVDEHAIRAGQGGYRDPHVLRSRDHGATWTAPRSLAESADRAEWRWYATGPGHAIQLAHGPHAGRLVVPANFSVQGSAANSHLGAHAVLSDDGGATWRIGAVDQSHIGDDRINPSECAVAELRSGRLVFHSRDQHGSSPATRLVTASNDGGETFTHPYREEPQLRAPVCQASLLTLPAADADLLVFSSPAQRDARRTLQLRLSRDGGRTWRPGPVLYTGVAAYSDLVALPGPRLGCLYEADGYHRIVFSVVRAPGLEAGLVSQP